MKVNPGPWTWPGYDRANTKRSRHRQGHKLRMALAEMQAKCPCGNCGGRDDREIARSIGYHAGRLFRMREEATR